MLRQISHCVAIVTFRNKRDILVIAAALGYLVKRCDYLFLN